MAAKIQFEIVSPSGVSSSGEVEQVVLPTTSGEIGVLPYYLHRLDPVSGSAHFAVDEQQAAALHRGMRAALPGYLVPKWVREEPGAAYKIPCS